jgi:hypothetical protein
MVFAPIYVRVIIGQNWLSGLLDYTIAQLHSWKKFRNIDHPKEWRSNNGREREQYLCQYKRGKIISFRLFQLNLVSYPGESYIISNKTFGL